MAIHSTLIHFDGGSVTIQPTAARWWLKRKRTISELLFIATLLVSAGTMMTLRLIMATPGLSLH